MKLDRNWTAVVLAFAGMCLLGFYAEARSCTPEEKATADRVLWLNAADKKRSVERHLPWGTPTGGLLLVQRDFVLSHDNNLRVPLWTAHRLDGAPLGRIDRIDCFRRDPRINAPAASLPADYSEPIFDQGHLTPNSDMSFAKNAVINSFIMSNMAPQYCQFNRGVWQIFESIVRLWAREHGTVHVITGSIFDRDNDGRRDVDDRARRMKSNNGKTRVAVPSHFFKTVLRGTTDGLDSLTVVLPHDQTDVNGEDALRYLARHVRPLGVVEAAIGTRVLPSFTGTIRQATQDSFWPFEGRAARSLVDDRCRTTAGADQ